MPVNDRYPLPDVLALCRRTGSAQAACLRRVRDARRCERLPAQARALAALLGRDAFKVNLIPYNPTGYSDGSSRAAIAAFKAALDAARVPPPFGSPAGATSRRPVGSHPPHRRGQRRRATLAG